MGWTLSSWLRETGRLFVLYLAVGLVFVPAGLVYALFIISRPPEGSAGLLGTLFVVPQWLVLSVVVAAGFLAAHFTWAALEKRLVAGPVELGQETSASVGEPYVDLLVGLREALALLAGEEKEFTHSTYQIHFRREQKPDFVDLVSRAENVVSSATTLRVT